MEKKALGRGLSALIPEKSVPENGPTETILHIPLSQIHTNKYQPRIEFNADKLNDLANSIREKGVVQPILVRRSASGYELIAGERRLRAVKALGMPTIPAILKQVQDIDMLELSLIENIQREELNPIEEACAFEKFITDFNFTQERIAKALGKDRSTIANIIRLLSLPKKIQEYISHGSITAGHAKALLSLPTEAEQLRISGVIIKKGLSVRETEALAARGTARPSSKKGDAKKEQGIIDIEADLQQRLGTRVKILHGKKRGRIQIEYYSNEDLNRILDILQPKRP